LKNRDHIYGFASQFLASAITFITSIIIVYSHGALIFGQYSLWFLVLMILRGLLNASFLVPMGTIAPSLNQFTKLYYLGFVLSAAVAGATAAFLVFLTLSFNIDLVAKQTKPDLVLSLTVAVSSALFIAVEVLRRYCFSTSDGRQAAIIDMARYSVQLLAAILTFSAPNHIAVALYFGGIGAGSLVGIFVAVPKVARCRLSRKLNLAFLMRHSPYLRWMPFSSFLESVVAAAPFFIGASLIGEQAVGQARTVQQITNVLNIPSQAFLLSSPSASASAFAREGTEGLQRFLYGLFWLSSKISLLSSLALFQKPRRSIGNPNFCQLCSRKRSN
jgi:O-antigen/teichoic acid export membrane protein